MKRIRLVLVWGLIFFSCFGGGVFLLRSEEADRPHDEYAGTVQDSRLGKQIYIPAGNYYVGSDDENDNKPLRSMAFKGFYMDIHPVTNAQYLEFLAGSHYSPQGPFDNEKAKECPLLPATDVTYEDARAYAEFFHKRLPTEWEWEIAARALKKENLYVSPELPPNRRGHFLYDRTYYPVPVFSYPPNEIGLYDMAGNVYEWTSGEYESKYLYGRHFQGFRLMVIRGGSWTNRAFDIRAATRIPFPAERSLGWLGFRCARDDKGSE